MLPYRFENNHIKFFRYQSFLDGEKHYLMSNLEAFNCTKIEIDEYLWIEAIPMKSTQLVNALLKDENLDKITAIKLLSDLLNSDSWKYGRWKLDKIAEYKLSNLEIPYSNEELYDLHNYREKVREIIRFYNNL